MQTISFDNKTYLIVPVSFYLLLLVLKKTGYKKKKKKKKKNVQEGTDLNRQTCIDPAQSEFAAVYILKLSCVLSFRDNQARHIR